MGQLLGCPLRWSSTEDQRPAVNTGTRFTADLRRLEAALVSISLVASVGPQGAYEMPQVSSNAAALAGSSLILQTVACEMPTSTAMVDGVQANLAGVGRCGQSQWL